MQPLGSAINSALESSKLTQISSLRDIGISLYDKITSENLQTCIYNIDNVLTNPEMLPTAVYLFGIALIIVTAWHVIFRGSISDTMESIRRFFGSWRKLRKK